jgi:hypothetical protein
MLSTRSYTVPPPKLTSTNKSQPRVRLSFMLAVAAFSLLVSSVHLVHAQSGASLSLGTLTVLNTPATCNPTSGWYYYKNGANTTYMNCNVASVSCSNTAPLNLTFGYLDLSLQSRIRQPVKD